MAQYFALRIIAGKLDYDAVIAKYPQLKDEIDEWLRRYGWTQEG